MDKKQAEEVMKGKAWEPKDGEGRNTFLSRCIKSAMDEGIEQNQATGKCYGIWNQKRDASAPKKGESAGVESTLSGGLLTVMSP
jgi:hypothetical protein